MASCKTVPNSEGDVEYILHSWVRNIPLRTLSPRVKGSFVPEDSQSDKINQIRQENKHSVEQLQSLVDGLRAMQELEDEILDRDVSAKKAQ